MKKKIYYRSSELKQRGWTDGLIKKFMPKPDETMSLVCNTNTSTVRFNQRVTTIQDKGVLFESQ